MYFDIPIQLIKQVKCSQDYWWNQYLIEISPDGRQHVSFADYLVLKLDGFLGDI